MKLSCKTSDLLQALHLTGKAIGVQQALPILGNVLLEVEGKRCRVSATDLEISITTSFEASIENEGSITVPAKAILNFAQYNNDPEVLLETSEGTQLKCHSKHSKAVIAGEAATEYPTITPVQKKITFSLDADTLLQALHLVTFACAKTSLRPVLSGVYLKSEKGKLTLVATDSYRLSEYVIPIPSSQEEFSCIMPSKVLDELKMILASRRTGRAAENRAKDAQDGKPEEKMGIDVTLSAQQVEFRLGNTQIISRLIDGKFPDYQQIIPKNIATTILFPIPDLTTAVKRMHYFAKEMNNNLTFRCAPGETTITTPVTQMGRDEAIVPGECNGSEVKIALSSSYLLDFLGHVPADSVEMCVSDGLHPAIFRLPQAAPFLHLIMPLRLQEE
jgi:DNA polymerase-3 subunit beta